MSKGRQALREDVIFHQQIKDAKGKKNNRGKKFIDGNSSDVSSNSSSSIQIAFFVFLIQTRARIPSRNAVTTFFLGRKKKRQQQRKSPPFSHRLKKFHAPPTVRPMHNELV